MMTGAAAVVSLAASHTAGQAMVRRAKLVRTMTKSAATAAQISDAAARFARRGLIPQGRSRIPASAATHSAPRSRCRDNNDRVAARSALVALDTLCARSPSRTRHSGRAGRTCCAGVAFLCGRARRSLWSSRTWNGHGDDSLGCRRHDHRRSITCAQYECGKYCGKGNRISHHHSSSVFGQRLSALLRAQSKNTASLLPPSARWRT